MSNLIIRKIKNNIFKYLVFTFAVLLAVPLLLILFYIVKEGISSLNWGFIFNLPKPVGETGGGIANAIIGTFELIFIASLIAIPFGIALGIYLTEFQKKKFTYYVRLGVDVLQGTPSIVIGMIAYLWIVKQMGSFSALSGGAALSIMMLPLIITSTEETLKLLPFSLKESAYALGVPYYAAIIRVVLPAAMNGIVTGIMLGVARIAGETAPLLFTAFGSPFMNLDVMKPISSLPHVIFTYATSPYKEWHSLAWGASLILILLILILNISAKMLAKRWKVKF
ncbi:MAG: phosphate ABC transporter permease PstA [Ignavibacteria bacterium]|jgi:phosphate transport system permease protein